MSYKRTAIHILVMVAVLSLLSACSTKTNEKVVQGASKTTMLNPLALQQFANPLPLIPVATPDTTTDPSVEAYTVVAEQTSGYDFGLRKKDGSEFIDPATGTPIRTTVWGYTTNGIQAGYLGATIEARSTLDGPTGKPVQVTYINNLKDGSGNLLAKHLLTVDPTLEGADNGEPEVRIVTHLHGGHVLPEFDGHPEAWITNNPNYAGAPATATEPARPAGNKVTYTYKNDQVANHLWYHDHAMGITRLNVYAGLAANYLLRDSVEDNLNLPKGAYEIPLVIQDKSFNQDGSLHYDANPLLKPDGTPYLDAAGNPVNSSNPEFFGNVITVNGKAWPLLNVEPRKYRFRVLNGSDSRFYNMWLERSDGGAIPAGAITQIGNDGGLMPDSVPVGDSADNGLLLALAERADLIIDFSKFPAGTSITIRNDAPTPFPGGSDVDPATTGRVMQFKISKPLAGPDTSDPIPANPRSLIPLDVATKTRFLNLQETEQDDFLVYDAITGSFSKRLKILINGLLFDDPITENPKIDSVEDWVIINDTEDAHPMHIHLVHFEVLEKGSVVPGTFDAQNAPFAPVGLLPNTNPDPTQPSSAYTLQPNERGRKDTVRVPPAQGSGLTRSQGYVKIRAKFDILGTYMWHCHILAHEDNAMMRPFTVIQ
ncbi:multicopper oxidase family protein [Pelotalea chapellei]|uniref:Multicopper oxidase domain-containing protein n=1 Tax=Pelotalea chapellei TaxID=44671 RepID=A0ABS5U5M4_9BACT|nr:multicopper oxidase domain-containing protein [Pelotalea chapellei]MBT1070955.1 multicopper oxidase domain-containing protein [Pelotalea chapellei]